MMAAVSLENEGIRARLEKAKALLVCKHCGKAPADHFVRDERLTCREGGTEWEYTDEWLVWDILQKLLDLDARKEQLTRRLFELTESGGQPWCPDAEDHRPGVICKECQR